MLWLFLKSNDPNCILFSRKRRRKGGRGCSPQKMFGATPFQSKKNALFDIKRALQKGHFRSFAEKGRDLDTYNPLVAR